MMEEFKKALFTESVRSSIDNVKQVAEKYNFTVQNNRIVAPNGKQYVFKMKNGQLRLKRCE